MTAIHDKIRKLLSLANGQANDNEAARAMEMASRLMMQHGIDEAELSDKPVKHEATNGSDIELSSMWYTTVASAVSKLMGTSFVRKWTKEHIFFVGRRDNVQMSEELFAYVVLQVEQLYKQDLPKGMTQQERAKYRKTYKEACAMRIHQRAMEIIRNMESQRDVKSIEAATSTSTALVIVAHREQLNEEIRAYFAANGIGQGRARKVILSHSGAAASGRAAGNRVELSKAVR